VSPGLVTAEISLGLSSSIRAWTIPRYAESCPPNPVRPDDTGQVNWLKFFFEGVYGEKPSEAVKDRFLKETKRLYLVLDQRLAINGDYVALDRPT
jgi:hypothetical protein